LKSSSKEGVIKKEIINYETLLKVTHGVVMSRGPEEVAGVGGFVQKPFSIAPFAEKLKEVLEGNR